MTSSQPLATDVTWHPPMLLRVSFAAHAAALAVVAARPSLWPWAAGGLAVNHAILAASGLWPRSSSLGANWTRLPPAATAAGKIAITIDDGPDSQVTPRVLDILEQYRAVASFFCIAERVAAQGALARDIVRRGHAIENHSHRHPNYFSLLGPRAMAAEIATAQAIISSTVGDAPLFFRAPAGLRNPFLDLVLTRQGLKLASWTRRGFDTVVQNPARVLSRLVGRLAAGDILLLHDGHAARTVNGTPVIEEVLPRLLDRVVALQLTPITLRAAL